MSTLETPHPFRAWLAAEKRTQLWAATRLGCGRMTLHRLFRFERRMDLEMMLKIRALTCGAVTPETIFLWQLDRVEAALERLAA